MKLTFGILLLLLSSVPACSDRSEAATTRRRVADSSSGTVVLGIRASAPYREIAVPSSGSIAGTISLQKTTPDSGTAALRDARPCGDTASIMASVGGGANGSALENVLVWVDSIAAGKPLVRVRRGTLTIERCRFEPRVMAVVSGTTINVFSRDRATYTSRFYREGAGEPVDEIHTVDAGQVVPSERIASGPGIVEARWVEHPWARAYVAVFDHPYHAVTDASGAFTIDSLPPGTYTVKLWHEGLAKPVEQRVVVSSDVIGRLDVALTLR